MWTFPLMCLSVIARWSVCVYATVLVTISNCRSRLCGHSAVALETNACRRHHWCCSQSQHVDVEFSVILKRLYSVWQPHCGEASLCHRYVTSPLSMPLYPNIWKHAPDHERKAETILTNSIDYCRSDLKYSKCQILTLAGGDVSGLLSKCKLTKFVISRSSTGNVAIRLQLISNETRFRQVTSKQRDKFDSVSLVRICVANAALQQLLHSKLPLGKYTKWLFRSDNDRKFLKSLIRAGKCVIWLQAASNSVNCSIRPSSSGSETSRLFETRSTWIGRKHNSRGKTVSRLLLQK